MCKSISLIVKKEVLSVTRHMNAQVCNGAFAVCGDLETAVKWSNYTVANQEEHQANSCAVFNALYLY